MSKDLLPSLTEAIAAIHRAIAAGLERHPGRLSALRAHDVEHLPTPAAAAHAAATAAAAATTTARRLLRRPAGTATLGFVCEPELREPLLLTRGERENGSAIHARDLLVLIHSAAPKKIRNRLVSRHRRKRRPQNYNRKTPLAQIKST